MHAAKHSLADTFASPGLVSLSARRNGRGLEGPEARVKRGRGDLRPWRMGQDRWGVHRCARAPLCRDERCVMYRLVL